jgi:DNA-binding NtrC family response regulator
MVPRILVVDDDQHLNESLVELFASEGFATDGALSAEEALARCRGQTYHLVLCDLQLPGRNGLSLIRILRDACPATQMILITGHGTIRAAVTALKRGAVEFMLKPVRPKRLLAVVRALLADPPAYLPNRLLADEQDEIQSFDGIQARSRAMRAVFERIRLAAGADTPVLVLGESGTGKELVARSIHQRSGRAGGPFVAVHAGGLPHEHLAHELFGYEKGAFAGAVERKPGRFELAAGGTIFLDEISTLDERSQLRLLRVLDTLHLARLGGEHEHPVDTRVVAASNQDLQALVVCGRFREDLLQRLGVLTVRLPTLRERPEDIAVLASEFVREFASKYGKAPATIPAATERLLREYRWPGNVRELRNVIEQAVLLARGSALEPQLLPQMLHREPPREEVIRITVGTPMTHVEKEVILRTLAAHGGNKTATACALGISRRSIYNKLAEYGIGDALPTASSRRAAPSPLAAAAGGGSENH